MKKWITPIDFNKLLCYILMATNKVKKIKKPKSKTQKDCDRLLSPIIIALRPKCLLCGRPTEVAHHFIKKSVSSFHRYNINNLINLCSKCHFLLHFNDEGLWNGRIALLKGKEWLDDLERHKRDYVKCNKAYYEETYKKLLALRDEV